MAFKWDDPADASGRDLVLCCCGCDREIASHDGKRFMIGGKEVHPECYYAAMGRELDEHPIKYVRPVGL